MELLPPQNLDSEIIVLTGICEEEDNFYTEEILEDFFYLEKHKKIFNAIKNIYLNKNCKIDIVILTEELKGNTEINFTDIAKILNNYTTKRNFLEHLNIIKTSYIKRKLLEVSYNYTKIANKENNVEDLISKAQKEFNDKLSLNSKEGVIKEDVQKLTVITGFSGFLPKYQVGNFIVASSLLPWRGGTNIINRFISPLSTASSFSDITL